MPRDRALFCNDSVHDKHSRLFKRGCWGECACSQNHSCDVVHLKMHVGSSPNADRATENEQREPNRLDEAHEDKKLSLALSHKSAWDTNSKIFDSVTAKLCLSNLFKPLSVASGRTKGQKAWFWILEQTSPTHCLYCLIMWKNRSLWQYIAYCEIQSDRKTIVLRNR